MAKFFVSYSRSVKDEVGKVVALLRASGHDVWWDGDIPIMADWWSTILDKIEWCEVFIFVTSEKSVESPYCIAELKYANDHQRPILPFMLEDPETLTLPRQLPERNQWLVYDGDPANMLGQINTAYNLIEWHKHTDISTSRPPEPNRGGVSLAKQYQDARQFALEMQFEEAKRLLQGIKHLDYREWGVDCDEWLACISSYEPLIDLIDHEATRDKAQHRWKTHVRKYGSDFDPYHIAEKLERKTGNLTIIVVGAISVVVVILLIGAWGSGLFTGQDNANETQIAQQGVTERSLTGQEQLATVNAERTALSLTEQAYNGTATVERVQNEAATAQQNQFNASETAAIKTVESLSTTPTDTPVPPTATDTITSTNTPTATDIPTNTPRLTSTPRPTDTPDPIQSAFTSVASNADWTPLEREFDGVMMVLVPAGCFDMGSNNGESDEQPVHKICFDEPFWIDKYEVTIQAFGESPSYIGIGYGSNSGCSPYSSASNEPRNCVTWNDARNFCEARSARMPTEAEWEYAARGPDNLTYPWGNELVGANVVYWSNSSNHTASVGSHPGGASWVGAEDMSGNVWEWVSSLYQPYPYGNDHESRSDSTSFRVLRGGSFVVNSSNLRAALRNSNNPTSYFGYSGGFRCALSVPNP